MTCKILVFLIGMFSVLQVSSLHALEITEQQFVSAFINVYLKNIELKRGWFTNFYNNFLQTPPAIELPIIHPCDGKFYVPSEEDLQVFNKDFYSWLDKNKILKPALTFDCDKYTMAYKLYSNIQYTNGKFGKSKIKETTAESLSIGEIQYKIEGKFNNDGSPCYHAINMIIFTSEKEGKTLLQIGFFDPQLLNFVKLTPDEVLSIYHVRF